MAELKDKDRVKSLEKGLTLLIVLSQQDQDLLLDDLTRLAGLSRTSCFRLLQSMKALNFVEQDPHSKRYRLGARNISIGAAALNNLSLRQISLPFMKKLRQETDETINLSILHDTEIVFIERLEARHIINTRLRIGSRLPAYCTCMGKAILAYLPQYKLNRILEEFQFERKTENTIVSAEALKRELEDVRVHERALNNEELEKGLCAIASPILNYTGEAVAALNVSFPLVRHSMGEAIRDFAPLVKEACREISSHFGFQGAKGRS